MLQGRRKVAENGETMGRQEPFVAQCTSTSSFAAFHNVRQQQVGLPPTSH